MVATDVIDFKALKLTNEQRSQYGMRYHDYTRYRKHCANRVHRLRSSSKMTHGKGREFKKLPAVTEENVKEGSLQLLLLEAERAWAYSHDLAASAAKTDDESKASTLRHNATGRFRRSIHWSSKLLSLCQALYAANRLSAEGLIQVTAYTLILNGRFMRYRENYEGAVVELSVARYLLDQLAAAAATSTEQALATSFADEIGAEIRHSAYQLGRDKAYEVDAIVSELAAKNKNTVVEGCDALVAKLRTEGEAGAKTAHRQKLKEFMWEGQAVPVRHPEIADALYKVQQEEQRLDALLAGKKTTSDQPVQAGRSRKEVTAYDAVLLALSEAEDVARRLVEAQQLNASTSAAPPGTRDIQFVHAFIVYQLLSRRIRRDLLLSQELLASTTARSSSTPKKPQAKTPRSKPEHVDARLYPAVVKLIDTMLQSFSQMRTLSIVDDSPDLSSAVDSRVSWLQARRCFVLARCYSPLNKFAEALTLTQHARLHLRETRSTLGTIDADPLNAGDTGFFPLDEERDLVKLEESLTVDERQFKLDWFAFNGGKVKAGDKSGGGKKPLFFDIALNYVQLDVDAIRRRAGLAAGGTPVAASSAPAASAGGGAAPKQVVKIRAEEESRASTPEPSSEAARGGGGGGISSLLGGWWGRK